MKKNVIISMALLVSGCANSFSTPQEGYFEVTCPARDGHRQACMAQAENECPEGTIPSAGTGFYQGQTVIYRVFCRSEGWFEGTEEYPEEGEVVPSSFWRRVRR